MLRSQAQSQTQRAHSYHLPPYSYHFLSPIRRCSNIVMWYTSLMTSSDLTEELDAANAAVAYARSVRQLHARRTEKGDPQREADIRQALRRLSQAMKPLRTRIGRFPHESQTLAAERARQPVRDASAAIQRERVKLWKMRSR